MGFEKGTLVLVDFTAGVKDSDEVIETTLEEDAKKHSMYDPDVQYRPRLVSLGVPIFPVLRALDGRLSASNVGEKMTVEIAPEDAFGRRDTKKIKIIPLRKLGEDAEKVSVGDTVEIDDKKGVIRFISSGRVQIDYNHKHAGKTIVYDAEIKKLLETDGDKITEILKYRLDTTDEIGFKRSGNTLDITVPEAMYEADGLADKKYTIQLDIYRFLSGLEAINFIETFLPRKTSQTGTAPPADAPTTDTSSAGTPSADAPPADAPTADTPTTDTPPAGAPPEDTPPADAPATDAPKPAA